MGGRSLRSLLAGQLTSIIVISRMSNSRSPYPGKRHVYHPETHCDRWFESCQVLFVNLERRLYLERLRLRSLLCDRCIRTVIYCQPFSSSCKTLLSFIVPTVVNPTQPSLISVPECNRLISKIVRFVAVPIIFLSALMKKLSILKLTLNTMVKITLVNHIPAI